MPVPLAQFVKQLEDSGVLAGDTLKAFLPPKSEPKDAEELAKEREVPPIIRWTRCFRRWRNCCDSHVLCQHHWAGEPNVPACPEVSTAPRRQLPGFSVTGKLKRQFTSRGDLVMVARGHVKNSVLVLNDGVRLPEGHEVSVFLRLAENKKTHSVLNIPPVSVGAVLRPLTSGDDLLGEMLEARS